MEWYNIMVYITFFVVLAFGIALLTSLIIVAMEPPYFIFHMDFSPGIYIFTSSGEFHYYHVGNKTILIINGGCLLVDDNLYIDHATVQPGYHWVMVKIYRDHLHTYLKYFIRSLPISMLVSAIILAYVIKKESVAKKGTQQQNSSSLKWI